MSRKQHLLQRGNRWYYNRAYPSGLTDEAGRKAFRVSLHTTSLDEALRSRPEAERLYWEAVDKARAAQAPTMPREPSETEAQALAVQWFRQAAAEQEASAEETARPDSVDAAFAAMPGELAELRRELVEEQGGPEARRIATAVAQGAGFAAPGLPLVRLIQRARIATAELFAARLVGDYGRRPGDFLFAAALSAEAASATLAEAQAQPQRTLADLERAFKADKWDGIKPDSRRAIEAVFKALRSIIDPKRAVASLGRDDGRAFFEAIKAMPSGYGKGKQWEGVDLRAAIERAKQEGLPGLAPATVNRVYMGFASTIFRWAVREGWLVANPVEGLRVKDPVAAQDKRDPFTPEQLQTLFDTPPWHPADKAPKGQPVRYWLPYIALYQGMRLGEIVQLRPASFRTVDGVHLFEVTGSLKNDNARRTLPVHPELVRLGLLEFVESRKGSDLLFEGQQARSGKWGDATGDWFGRQIKALGFEGARLGVHSFRHNFQDALRRAGLHGTALGAALAGRAGGDKVADAYGSGFAPAQLAEAIAKISYPGL